jgi:hypothetical protein
MNDMTKRNTAVASDETLDPEVAGNGTYAELVGAIGGLLEKARERIASTANTTLVATYWNTGRYIVEYEQHGADRAKYGSGLLSHLTRDLTLRYGKGYGKSNLVYMRKLYRAFPKGMTLSCKLSRSHNLEILKCPDELAIGFPRRNARELQALPRFTSKSACVRVAT